MFQFVLPRFVLRLAFICLFVCLLGTIGCSSNSPTPTGPAAGNTEPNQKIDSAPPAIKLSQQEITASQLPPRIEASSGQFIDLPSELTGVEFINRWPTKPETALQNSFVSAGVAAADFNNDGLVDFFAARRSDGGRLYQNLGEFRFEDVTDQFGLSLLETWGTGATWADVNNDGRLDLYVCGYDSPNHLYINYGDRFIDETKKYGLEFNGASVVMTFCDYDRDGDLDAYLLTNRLQKPQPKFTPIMTPSGPRVPEELRESVDLMPHPDGKHRVFPAGQFDHLYQNQDGKFREVSDDAGIGRQPYFGLSATWWDYDNDSWPDLYVANDFQGRDHLYKNNGPDENGRITFTDMIQEAIPHTPWFSMGSDAADVNNDGRFDLLASDMAGTNHYRDKLSMGGMSGPDSRAWFLNWPNPPQYMRNCLYLNSGTERFMEAAFLFGVAKSDWTWTVRFCDFDQDGWQDVYFTNGMSRDWFNGDMMAESARIKKAKGPLAAQIYRYTQPKYKLKNLVFRNTGKLGFENVSQSWGLDHFGVSSGGASADFDGDGDMDLVINGFDEPLKIYRNEVSNGSCLKIKLVGRSSNRQAIGARVELFESAHGESAIIQTRFVSSNQGFMSSSEPIVHFGTGDAKKISRLLIHWPSGATQEFTDLETNACYTITEAETSPTEKLSLAEKKSDQETIFERNDSIIPISVKHSEVEFDDFQRQPLIPNKYSQLGPGQAWGDINGDGDADCFLGGAHGAAGQLLVNEQGQLISKEQKAIQEDSAAEDMGALFFDADGDGDRDLYVVSGGVEDEKGSAIYQDRLYLNDGNGGFSDHTSDWLPEIRFSGSCVSAADFDRDGDLDLFVGGRIIPGEYPLAPNSMLLVNEGDRFVDQINEVASELTNAGMVTAGLWTDVNNDGWMDLMVCYEWGPIRVFVNDQGQLQDDSEAAGLQQHLGWFNSICGGDLDGDGDTDYVAGNFGLNTKYDATPEKPELLYYGNFGDRGEPRIVEAKYENGVCLPRRGLGCTSNAIPLIKTKLPTYHEFALSPLQDIYRLEGATKFEANELESLVLINQSTIDSVSFSVEPLPRIAQISPIFGCALSDMNGDGNLDLFVAQNFSGPQRETGNMDGGVSMFLEGLGNGQFQPIWPSVSGVIIPEDARSLAIVDIDQNRRPDLMIGINNDAPVYLQNKLANPMKTIRLVGPAKNVAAIGSRVQLTFADGRQQSHELYAGGGYLSQSAAEIFVADSDNLESIDIRWPDGTQKTVSAPLQFTDESLVIQY
jgi:hypothetical protein